MSAQPLGLPPGWTEVYDAGTNKVFYVNQLNRVTQWDRPMAPPPGWSGMDQATAPIMTGGMPGMAMGGIPIVMVQQSSPPPMVVMTPPQMAITSTAPPPTGGVVHLPPPWVAIVDPKTKKVYYANTKTGETQWTPPVTPEYPGQLPPGNQPPPHSHHHHHHSPSPTPVATSPRSTAASTPASTPAALPTGWEERVDAATRTKYYVNVTAGKMQWNCPSAAIEITGPLCIQCKAAHLPSMDLTDTADPYFLIKNPLFPDKELFRSETIKGTQSPKWDIFVLLLPTKDVNQLLVVEAWDWDRFSSNDLIGTFSMPARELLEHGTVTKDLLKDGSKRGQFTISILCPVDLYCEGRNLPKMDFTGKAGVDPYFKVKNPSKKNLKLFKSEILKDNANPKWKFFSLCIANTELDEALCFEVVDWDRFSANDKLYAVTKFCIF
ncbi:synaptotagmin-7 [Pelomyxa schiedti]|nr:synaptotagmin-7 [Pelomyxa schiedti]